MKLSNLIGLEDLTHLDERERFQRIFAHYIGLDIPYETLSNFDLQSLIKTPAQIAHAVSDAGGGHCVEHVSLLDAVFREQNIPSKVVNADHTDFKAGVYSDLAITYALASVGGELLLCDPFYGALYAKVPKAGGTLQDHVVTKRIDSNRFVFMTFDGDGLLTREDVIHEDSDLSARQKIFESRYVDFFPFGVVAPYYQVVRPISRSLYYSPKFDCYIVQENRKSYQLPLDGLSSCGWIPDRFREKIPRATETNRSQRSAAQQFLRLGLFNPYYKSVESMKSVAL
jgi:hypothetical protein